MRQANLPVPSDYLFDGPNGRLDEGEAGASYFLGLSTPPTAILCYNDLMAIGLMHRYRESNLLTTFEQAKYELGYAAARMMNLLTYEIPENQRTKTEVLWGTLIIRESTAPPEV
jgi:DNA-binding LacI/PurR family transcriptional regulator